MWRRCDSANQIFIARYGEKTQFCDFLLDNVLKSVRLLRVIGCMMNPNHHSCKNPYYMSPCGVVSIGNGLSWYMYPDAPGYGV